MGMNKNRKTYLTIVLVTIAAVAYMWWPSLSIAPNSAQPSNHRLMPIEDYVSQNISTLSPQKEILGGTFYVTHIEAANGVGRVSYEDGHVGYTADFTYTTTDRGHDITSFDIRN